MPVPVSQMYTVTSYVLGQKLRGNRRYPLVLMLEPLYRCNLACAGCGKIQYPSNILKSQLSYEECMKAVDECPAPVVSLPGGEPLLHPEIDRIVRGLVERKKYVYLCTNGLLLEEKLDLFEPSKYLSFSVHMDGLEAEHDEAVCREGTYAKAYAAIEKALTRGFRVTTNTTLFEGADPGRTRDFFDSMMQLGVEGMMISPGYAYEAAPDRGHFLGRDRTRNLFRRILSTDRRKGWRFNQSPLFLEFLTGAVDYDCTPWGNPTYSVFGWQKPCYLLQEGYADSFQELVEETEWDRYGHASGNPRCRDCLVHSGFEASAVNDAFSSLRGLARMARAVLFGAKIPAPSATAPLSGTAISFDQDDSLQGQTLVADDRVLNDAFEYRGDVSLELDGGELVEGYVSNVTPTVVALWRKGSSERVTVDRSRVKRVLFSGVDTAARMRAA